MQKKVIAHCLCNNMTPSQTQPPLNLREALSFERQGYCPGTKTQQICTIAQSTVFTTTPPPWILTRLPLRALRAGLLPPSCKFSGISTDFCQFQEVIWSPWLRGVVSPEQRDCCFYTKSITALSKLSFERLPAMCWTWPKISGNPVFKTLGRFYFVLKFILHLPLRTNITERKGKIHIHIYLTTKMQINRAGKATKIVQN